MPEAGYIVKKRDSVPNSRGLGLRHINKMPALAKNPGLITYADGIKAQTCCEESMRTDRPEVRLGMAKFTLKTASFSKN